MESLSSSPIGNSQFRYNTFSDENQDTPAAPRKIQRTVSFSKRDPNETDNGNYVELVTERKRSIHPLQHQRITHSSEVFKQCFRKYNLFWAVNRSSFISFVAQIIVLFIMIVCLELLFSFFYDEHNIKILKYSIPFASGLPFTITIMISILVVTVIFSKLIFQSVIFNSMDKLPVPVKYKETPVAVQQPETITSSSGDSNEQLQADSAMVDTGLAGDILTKYFLEILVLITFLKIVASHVYDFFTGKVMSYDGLWFLCFTNLYVLFLWYYMKYNCALINWTAELYHDMREKMKQIFKSSLNEQSVKILLIEYPLDDLQDMFQNIVNMSSLGWNLIFMIKGCIMLICTFKMTIDLECNWEYFMCFLTHFEILSTIQRASSNLVKQHNDFIKLLSKKITVGKSQVKDGCLEELSSICHHLKLHPPNLLLLGKYVVGYHTLVVFIISILSFGLLHSAVMDNASKSDVNVITKSAIMQLFNKASWNGDCVCLDYKLNPVDLTDKKLLAMGNNTESGNFCVCPP